MCIYIYSKNWGHIESYIYDWTLDISTPFYVLLIELGQFVTFPCQVRKALYLVYADKNESRCFW